MRSFFETNYDLDSSSIKCGQYFGKGEIGEIFIEHLKQSNILMQNGILQTCSVSENSGFGARKVFGEQISYVSSSDISTKEINKALSKLYKFTKSSKKSAVSDNVSKANELNLYALPVSQDFFEDDLDIVFRVNEYLNKNRYVSKSTISLTHSIQHVLILLPDGSYREDARPLIKLQASVIVEKNGRSEIGSAGLGGRVQVDEIKSSCEAIAQQAIDQGLINTESVSAPVGEMPVVLSSGWTGIILHEAIGHGLEADFNRKGVSAFSQLMGKEIASPKVTIVDDGTIPGKRGSINFDDEGTPSEKTVLVENGVLKSYMSDKQNAALLGVASTGNGRRESYKHVPYPRMTNTYMLSGADTKEEMIESVKRGVYAVSFSGGQVDITSGKFVFSASEAYLIEDGKLTKPIKGASIVGDGPSILKRVSMVGQDFSLDPGVGTCGKNGQMVPVCVGQPSIKIDNITVGGTM